MKEDLYVLKFDGLVTPEGEKQLRFFERWEFFEGIGEKGNWSVLGVAKNISKDKFNELMRICHNGDCVIYGFLKLEKENAVDERERLVRFEHFDNIGKRSMKGITLKQEEDMEKTKELEQTSAECDLDVEGEKERLEKLKKEFEELYEQSRGKIVVDYAKWDEKEGMAIVCSHPETPDNYDELEHRMREIASDMLHAQNMIGWEEERRRYEWKEKIIEESKSREEDEN